MMKKRHSYFTFWLLPFLTVTLSSCLKKSESVVTQTKISESSTKKTGSIWTCPMHPQIKKEGPGTCPICGMTLVPAGSLEETQTGEQKTDLPDGHASFKLSLSRQQMIGVKHGLVEKKILFKSIEAAGRVAFDPELYTAQSEFIEALKQKEQVKDSAIPDVAHSAERMVESAKLRLKVLGLSDPQIANITSSGSAGSSLLVPKKGESLWIYADVYEMDLASIRPGLEAKVSGGALGGKEVSGRVVSVDRVINPAARTAKVRILLPNARSMLRPEAYVDVSIRSPLGEQIVVPFDAVLDTGKQAWVFVLKDGGLFEPRLVIIRFRADDEIAIESGVAAGEKIVTSANFLIDSESKLKGVLLSQNSDEASSPQAPTIKNPECPKGQVWHSEMKHCMEKIGN